MIQHLLMLNFIFHSISHSEGFVECSWSIWRLAGIDTGWQIKQSSGDNQAVLWMCVTSLLMYIKNRVGPRANPAGHQMWGRICVTQCDLFDKNDMIQSSSFPLIPWYSSFYTSLECANLSKALENLKCQCQPEFYYLQYVV